MSSGPSRPPGDRPRPERGFFLRPIPLPRPPGTVSVPLGTIPLSPGTTRHGVPRFRYRPVPKGCEYLCHFSSQPRHGANPLNMYLSFHPSADPTADENLHSKLFQPTRPTVPAGGRPIFQSQRFFASGFLRKYKYPPAGVKNRSDPSLVFRNCHFHDSSPRCLVCIYRAAFPQKWGEASEDKQWTGIERVTREQKDTRVRI